MSNNFKVKNTNIQQATNNTIYNLEPNSVDYISTDDQTIRLDTTMTSFTNTGVNYSATLPNPAYNGQIKYVMIGDSKSNTSATITVNYNEAPNNVPSTFVLSGIGAMNELFGSSQGWTEW